MKKHLLEVRDLRVSFDTYAGEVQAVRGVNFHLDAGETLAIVGESGCGKSVSMQTIMKLLPSPPVRLKSGEILFEGRDLAKLSDKEMEPYRGKDLSMIFQDSMTSLNPTMRVGKQMCEGIRCHQKVSMEEARRIAVDMLAQVGLPDPEGAFRRYPHTMSGGQRQRVMIAMALACNPKILIADEPTTALDVTMQAQILDIMKQLQQTHGTAIILITHDLGVVAKMAQRIEVMYAGEIMESGDARQIFYAPEHPYTWGLLGAMPNLIQKVQEDLYTIPGTPPDLYAPPAGCPFAARCAYAMECCLMEEPPVFDCGEGHSCRCWLKDPRAPRVQRPEGLFHRDEKGGNSNG